jgi:YidC/Oxa1 family membrane protein insertase
MRILAANPLQPLIDAAHWILVYLHDNLGLSWGLSIIGLTVVVRTLILPLTYKSIQGMREVQRHAPELKKLQEKYKDDPKRKQEEMMRFYQEHKFNPLGSCLPLVLQFPVFLALFYLLRSNEFKTDIRGEESFLFIENLAEPATGLVLVVLATVYVGTQLAASLVTAISADRMQRYLILALPFVFVPFILSFQAGLLVYWITTNVWTIGQQFAVKKLMPPPEPLPSGAKSGLGKTEGTKPTPGRGGRKRPFTAGNGQGAADAARSARAAAPVAGGAKGNGKGNGKAASPQGAQRRKKKRSGRRR